MVHKLVNHKNSFYYLLLFLIFISCQSSNSNSIHIEGFDNKKWMNDSLGCLGDRKEQSIKLKSQFNTKISHKGKKQLLSLLGEPSLKHAHMGDSIFTYFVGKDRQCFDSLWKEHEFSDAEQILFKMDKKNEVIGITGPIIP